MQIYTITKDTPIEFTINKSDLLFPCMIIDLRNQTCEMFENEESNGIIMADHKNMEEIGFKTNLTFYSMYRAFGATEVGVLDEDVVGIYDK